LSSDPKSCISPFGSMIKAIEGLAI
jgi:hypothetical protein